MCLKPFKKAKHEEFRAQMVRASAGALWNIEGPPRPASLVAKKSNDSHLMEDLGGPGIDGPLRPPPPRDLANVANELSDKATVSAVKDADPPQQAIAQHIMISYDWDHKEPVRKMNTALQALGYRTWLDVEQMSASKIF
jgi:hypothetical protein